MIWEINTTTWKTHRSMWLSWIVLQIPLSALNLVSEDTLRKYKRMSAAVSFLLFHDPLPVFWSYLLRYFLVDFSVAYLDLMFILNPLTLLPSIILLILVIVFYCRGRWLCLSEAQNCPFCLRALLFQALLRYAAMVCRIEPISGSNTSKIYLSQGCHHCIIHLLNFDWTWCWRNTIYFLA